LKRRGYNDKVIESGFSKASEIKRNDLLESAYDGNYWVKGIDAGL
jgi:hypothetical protein